MRKQLCITMTMLATVLLLAVPCIAHHHHDSAQCTVVEHCSSDNADNDRHTHHDDDGSSCIEKEGAIMSKPAYCQHAVSHQPVHHTPTSMAPITDRQWRHAVLATSKAQPTTACAPCGGYATHRRMRAPPTT